jgi:hypothetical protein
MADANWVIEEAISPARYRNALNFDPLRENTNTIYMDHATAELWVKAGWQLGSHSYESQYQAQLAMERSGRLLISKTTRSKSLALSAIKFCGVPPSAWHCASREVLNVFAESARHRRGAPPVLSTNKTGFLERTG